MKIEFEYKGVWITNPTLDETGRFEVNPVEYYGETLQNLLLNDKVRIIDKYLTILALETLREQCQDAEDQENVKRINKELNKIK